LGLPVVVGDVPLGLDPAAALEAMQRRVQRALLHLERVVGNLLDAFGNRPAVLRLERDGFQDQEIERALRQIHGSPFASTGVYPISCRSARGVAYLSSRQRAVAGLRLKLLTACD